jgi:lysophospholipase L1-like esterase
MLEKMEDILGEFYNNRMNNYDFTDYDCVIIWLGTNGGLDSDDIEVSGTQTNYYCRIIEYIQQQNPNCKIFIAKVFVTGPINVESQPNVSTTNTAIELIGNNYNIPILDLSDLGYSRHPELHDNILNINPDANATHFGKAGNIVIATRWKNFLQKYFNDDVLNCEFGLMPKN